MPSMHTVLITENPDLAASAEAGGVGRIMVDLERNGKFERQQFRDTWISKHRMEDIAPVAKRLTRAEVMVRINPLYDESATEIDQAVDAGADLIMLPMFRTLEEAARIGDMIAGRAKFVPLVETGDALAILEETARLKTVDEMFIGLNDLHISLGLDFMFEPLASGVLDSACAVLREVGKPFGFGGIARVGEGDLPAENIIREHARLGSTRVNLSRTFARDGESVGITGNAPMLEREVRSLLELYDEALTASEDQVQQNRQRVKEVIDQIVARIRAARVCP